MSLSASGDSSPAPEQSDTNRESVVIEMSPNQQASIALTGPLRCRYVDAKFVFGMSTFQKLPAAPECGPGAAPGSTLPSDAPENMNLYLPEWCKRDLSRDPSHTCDVCERRPCIPILSPIDFLGLAEIPEDSQFNTFDKYWEKLPGELRVKVIAAALDVPRLMTSNVEIARKEHPLSQSAAPPNLPALYFVNRECRAEVERHLKQRSTATATNYFSYPWSYINPSFDIVYCNENPPAYPDSWYGIPTGKEAKGLQTLALKISNVNWFMADWSDSPCISKDDAEKLATQIQTHGPRAYGVNDTLGQLLSCLRTQTKKLAIRLHDLPDLKEVLLVRTLPRWMKHFFYCEECPKDTPRPELIRTHTGFFYKTDITVESWFRGSRPYEVDWEEIFCADGAQNEDSDLALSLIEKNDKELCHWHGYSTYRAFSGGEATSEFIEAFAQKWMKDFWLEMGFDEKKFPKLEVVYQNDVVAQLMDHSVDGSWE